MNNWNFEIFGLNDVAEGQCLKFVAFDLFQKYSLLSKFKVPDRFGYLCNRVQIWIKNFSFKDTQPDYAKFSGSNGQGL